MAEGGIAAALAPKVAVDEVTAASSETLPIECPKASGVLPTGWAIETDEGDLVIEPPSWLIRDMWKPYLSTEELTSAAAPALR